MHICLSPHRVTLLGSFVFMHNLIGVRVQPKSVGCVYPVTDLTDYLGCLAGAYGGRRDALAHDATPRSEIPSIDCHRLPPVCIRLTVHMFLSLPVAGQPIRLEHDSYPDSSGRKCGLEKHTILILFFVLYRLSRTSEGFIYLFI